MTHTATIKIAPIFTLERFDDPAWRSDRTMYESGALSFLPGTEEIPLLISHDEQQVVGVVHELMRMEWVDGLRVGPWIVARCTVEDRPEWLGRYTRASFGFKTLHRREVNIRGTKADVIARAIVHEVSVLPESVQPAEPLAAVVSIRPIEDEVIYGKPGQVLRRYFDTKITVR